MNVGEEMEWKGRDMSELLNVASTPLAGVASGVTDPMIDKADTALREARVGALGADDVPKIPETGAPDGGMTSNADGGENPYESSYYPAPPFTPPPDIGLAETVLKSEVVVAQAQDVVREDVQVDTQQADVAAETTAAVAEESPVFAPAAPAIATEDSARKDAIAHDKAEAAVAEVRAIQETSTDQSYSTVA